VIPLILSYAIRSDDALPVNNVGSVTFEIIEIASDPTFLRCGPDPQISWYILSHSWNMLSLLSISSGRTSIARYVSLTVSLLSLGLVLVMRKQAYHICKWPYWRRKILRGLLWKLLWCCNLSSLQLVGIK
jgi:hypothetical protein